MKKALLIIVSLVLTYSASAASPLKIGFIYVSPIGDAGWTYQHDLGRIAAEKKFGDKIETKFIEDVKEGPDSERIIRQLASSGYGLIFATSFGFMNPTLKTAKKFPKVIFQHATGYKTAKNMGNYSPRFYEGRYLAGIAAAEKTKSNILGYVGAFPIPEVVRGINAFTLGAQSVNPKIQVKVIWSNSWFDPGKEAEVASSLIAQGADVITHHTDSVAAVKTAKDKGVLSISYHSDMQSHGGDAQIGAVVHNWEDFYINVIQDVLDGKWKSKSVWYGIEQGMVEFKPTSKLSDKTMKEINKFRKGIVDGSLSPFQGPIYNQAGKLVIAKGKRLTDAQLQKMDYFVKGVDGKVGK